MVAFFVPLSLPMSVYVTAFASLVAKGRKLRPGSAAGVPPARPGSGSGGPAADLEFTASWMSRGGQLREAQLSQALAARAAMSPRPSPPLAGAHVGLGAAHQRLQDGPRLSHASLGGSGRVARSVNNLAGGGR